MRELLYTILELEEWCSKDSRCAFCTTLYSDEDIAVCQIRTRSEVTEKIIANNYACENCKEKFENGELPKCDRCGRLQTRARFLDGKYVCRCVEYEGDTQQEELPTISSERRQTAFYERQINELRGKLVTAEEALEIEREEVEKFQKKSKEWSERQKQELLDEIKRLQYENERLREQLKAQIEVKK